MLAMGGLTRGLLVALLEGLPRGTLGGLLVATLAMLRVLRLLFYLDFYNEDTYILGVPPNGGSNKVFGALLYPASVLRAIFEKFNSVFGGLLNILD